MTDSSAPPRPRQVTLSAWLIMLGSVLVVLTVFERVSGLQSLETQQGVEQFLSEPPGSGLGLGVQGVIEILRVLGLVAGASAAATGILGFYVLQRSRGARIALSVLAAPLFVAGMATGGFMSSLVVVSAVMLWFQPARDWFNGITPEVAPPAAERPVERPADRPAGETEQRHGVDAPVGGAPAGAPPAYPGFGTAPAAGQQPGWPPPPPGAPVPGHRPGGVLAACVLTWVMSSLAAVLMAISAAVLVASPGRVYDEVISQNPELADQGIGQDVLVEATYVLGAVVIVWSLVAIALAVLVFRRVGWARPVLMASAGVSGLVCLLALAVGQVLTLLPLTACVATVALLVRADARAWLRP